MEVAMVHAVVKYVVYKGVYISLHRLPTKS